LIKLRCVVGSAFACAANILLGVSAINVTDLNSVNSFIGGSSQRPRTATVHMSLHPTIIPLRGLSRIDEVNQRPSGRIFTPRTVCSHNRYTAPQTKCFVSSLSTQGSCQSGNSNRSTVTPSAAHIDITKAKPQKSRIKTRRVGDRCLSSQSGLSTNAKANERSSFRDTDIRRAAMFHDRSQYWCDAHRDLITSNLHWSLCE
jgi:hypothetical protein